MTLHRELVTDLETDFLLDSDVDLSGTRAWATFSQDRVYRWSLGRNLNDQRVTRCLWIMLNPSTADALYPDPTVRRCIAFTRAWGLDIVEVVNLFALMSTDPKKLRTHPEPVGARNDDVIRVHVEHATLVVCAWGTPGSFLDREATVAAIVGHKAQCLGVNRDGSPKHPLYLRASSVLQPWRRA